MIRATRKSYKPALLLCGLVTLALIVRLIPGPRTVDDAYITFRYARNLVNGHGFVYNPGERVLGTTTPLYTLTLAGLSLLTGSQDFPTLAVPVNALAGALSVGLLWLVGRRLTGSRVPATIAAVLWAIAPFSVTFAIGGMETDVTIALLLAAADAHLRQRPYCLAFLSAFAILARPDTVILLGMLWLDQAVARKALPWREGLVSLGVLAPWLILGTIYFGSPIPGSIAAKSVTYRLSPEANLVRLIQHYSTPFLEHTLLGSRWQLIGFAVYLFICAVGSLRAVRRDHRVWPTVTYPWVYLAVFAISNPLLFRWYLSPPLPFYILTIVGGIWTLVQDLDGIAARHSAPIRFPVRPSIVVTCTFALAATISTLNAWAPHPDHGPDRPAPDMAWFKLEQLYTQAAGVVLAENHPYGLLCAADIGALGYYTDMRILDTVGLVTPMSRDYYPADPAIHAITYAIPPDLILDTQPDVIVILEIYGRLGLLPDPRFQSQYRLVRKIPTDIYGSDGMLIYVRR
ncbi:MAG: hypothetical protein GX620_09560 [Chloroflexi bacterium]|nr:hypothetical protein [Chloroflexota bacterium]